MSGAAAKRFVDRPVIPRQRLKVVLDRTVPSGWRARVWQALGDDLRQPRSSVAFWPRHLLSVPIDAHSHRAAIDAFRFPDGARRLEFGKWFEQEDLPIHVEIGTGFGHWLEARAAAETDVGWVGIDLRWRRALCTLARVVAMPNARAVCADAHLFFDRFVPSLSGVHINYPEPWPKRSKASAAPP